VVVVMIGDGTTNTGYFHEGMNFAAVQDLPMVCIIENNQYAVSTPIWEAARAKDLSSRAVGYGIPGVTVDGNDVRAVYGAVHEAVARARRGDGPTLIECKTYRWSGQVLGDPDRHRPEAEKEAARKECPVLGLKGELARQGILSEDGYAKMVADAGARIGEAIDAARALPALDAGSDPLRDYWPYADSGEVPA
jgi:pyruvate dehydrogenase E1 component alpha subunit